MALEEVNTIYIPFIGEYEIDSLSAVVLLVLGLIAGSTVWNMTDSIGSNLASTVNAVLGGFLPGGNPAQAGDSEVPGV